MRQYLATKNPVEIAGEVQLLAPAGLSGPEGAWTEQSLRSPGQIAAYALSQILTEHGFTVASMDMVERAEWNRRKNVAFDRTRQLARDEAERIFRGHSRWERLKRAWKGVL